MRKIVIVASFLMLFLISLPLISAGENISLPSNYKSWNHVKTMVIKKGHALFEPFGGIHSIYANNKAIKGYTEGKFPVGSVIVFDLFEAVDDGNAITEGDRKFIGIMEKSNGSPKTSGWIYEVFAGDKLKAKGVNGASDCHACHSSAFNKDFVFSTLRK